MMLFSLNIKQERQRETKECDAQGSISLTQAKKLDDARARKCRKASDNESPVLTRLLF